MAYIKNNSGTRRRCHAPAKEDVRRLLDLLPDDVSLEDIQYHIYVRQKIERGLKDITAGRMIPEEELETRISKYR